MCLKYYTLYIEIFYCLQNLKRQIMYHLILVDTHYEFLLQL